MADLQRNLDDPAVRPGYLLVCSEWLHQRQTLLQAERSAWQILPSTVGQISRLEVSLCTSSPSFIAPLLHSTFNSF